MTTDNTEHSDDIKWYVMRIYKREAQAEEALKSSYGLEHFIAKMYTVRTFHGKKTRILTPAIPSIIFVHSNRKGIREFKEHFSGLQYSFRRNVDGTEYPLTVPDGEMNAFITIARQYEEDVTYHNPDEIQLNKGTRVKVHGGPFDGLEGTLLKVKGKRSKRIVVKIDGIVAISSAEVSPDLIEVVS